MPSIPWVIGGWMLVGGLCYTIGTLFLLFDARIRHFHAVWHMLVIAGSAFHFLGILESVALAVSNAQIRRESAARATALQQNDAALTTARDAVNQMLTDVASEKFNNVPIAHPLRVSLLKGAQRFYEQLMQLNETDRSLVPEMAQVLYNMAGLQRELGQKRMPNVPCGGGLSFYRPLMNETRSCRSAWPSWRWTSRTPWIP